MNLENQITIEAWVKVQEFPEGSDEFWQNQDYIYIISQANDGSSVGKFSKTMKLLEYKKYLCYNKSCKVFT